MRLGTGLALFSGMRTTLATLVAAVVAVGCGDDIGPLTERAAEVGDAIDDLEVEITAHCHTALASVSVDEIRVLAEAHEIRADDVIDDLEYWVDQVAACVDGEGHRPPVYVLDDLIELSRSDLAMHRLAVAMAPSLEAALAEVERYRDDSEARVSNMRSQQLVMVDLAERYVCP